MYAYLTDIVTGNPLYIDGKIVKLDDIQDYSIVEPLGMREGSATFTVGMSNLRKAHFYTSGAVGVAIRYQDTVDTVDWYGVLTGVSFSRETDTMTLRFSFITHLFNFLQMTYSTPSNIITCSTSSPKVVCEADTRFDVFRKMCRAAISQTLGTGQNLDAFPCDFPIVSDNLGNAYRWECYRYENLNAASVLSQYADNSGMPPFKFTASRAIDDTIHVDVTELTPEFHILSESDIIELTNFECTVGNSIAAPMMCHTLASGSGERVLLQRLVDSENPLQYKLDGHDSILSLTSAKNVLALEPKLPSYTATFSTNKELNVSDFFSIKLTGLSPSLDWYIGYVTEKRLTPSGIPEYTVGCGRLEVGDPRLDTLDGRAYVSSILANTMTEQHDSTTYIKGISKRAETLAMARPYI